MFAPDVTVPIVKRLFEGGRGGWVIGSLGVSLTPQAARSVRSPLRAGTPQGLSEIFLSASNGGMPLFPFALELPGTMFSNLNVCFRFSVRLSLSFLASSR